MTLTLPRGHRDLPPPTVFEHNETLHAIVLPPLAFFLANLQQSDHLIKLNDILERYRTPKSYHRVDVREVPVLKDSVREGELASVSHLERPNEVVAQEDGAAGSLDGATQGEELRSESLARRKEEKERLPIELPEGTSLEDWKQGQSGVRPPEGVTESGQATDRTADDSSKVQPTAIGRVADATDSSETVEDALPPLAAILEPAPVDDKLKDETARSSDADLKVEAPDAVSSSLPATGSATDFTPKTRVRELRLDLRTLDAAALFALETWRREVMALPKLELQHPDSIWFRQPTPPPPPTVLPKLNQSQPQKLDRLKKDAAAHHTKPVKHTTRKAGGREASSGTEDDGVPVKATFIARVDSPIKMVVPEGESEIDEFEPDAELNDSDESIFDLHAVLPDLHDANEQADPDFEPEEYVEYTGKPRGRPRKEIAAVSRGAQEPPFEPFPRTLEQEALILPPGAPPPAQPLGAVAEVGSWGNPARVQLAASTGTSISKPWPRISSSPQKRHGQTAATAIMIDEALSDGSTSPLRSDLRQRSVGHVNGPVASSKQGKRKSTLFVELPGKRKRPRLSDQISGRATVSEIQSAPNISEHNLDGLDETEEQDPFSFQPPLTKSIKRLEGGEDWEFLIGL